MQRAVVPLGLETVSDIGTIKSNDLFLRSLGLRKTTLKKINRDLIF